MSNWKIIDAGGTVKDFEDDLSFRVLQDIGTGMPPVENVLQPLGQADGALFQRTRALPRTFSLTGNLTGTSNQDLRQQRQALIDLIKRDRLSGGTTPATIRYVGDSGSTVRIDAYYQSGLEKNAVEANSEVGVTLQFIAPDPFWYRDNTTNTALDNRDSVGSNGGVKYIDTDGTIVTLGTWGTANGDNCYAITEAESNGTTIYAGGDLSDQSLQRWTGATWEQVGTINTIYTLLPISSSDTLYIGGDFTTADGTTVNNVASLNTSTDTYSAMGNGFTYIGSAASAEVRRMAIDGNGNIYACGQIDATGGNTIGYVSYWDGSSWNYLNDDGAGTGNNGLNDIIYAIAVDVNDNVYLGGAARKYNNGGTALTNYGVFKYDSENDSFSVVGSNDVLSNIIEDIFIDDDETIYILTQADTSSNGKGLWKLVGNSWVQQFDFDGSGIRDTGSLHSDIVKDTQGRLIMAARPEITGFAYGYGVSHWDGSSLISMGYESGGGVNIAALYAASDGKIFIGTRYNSSGDIMVGRATVNNPGSASIHPVITMTGSGILEIVKNGSTGDVIATNIRFLSNETITINTKTGKVTSNIRGNVISNIKPGSNLTDFSLVPGNNTVVCFVSSGGSGSTISWDTEAYWSLDGIE